MSRDEAMRAFLAGSGFEGARIEPLAQDASFRRYWRLTGALGGAVLMDAPAPEDVRPFLRIAAHLEAIGLSVPRVFKADAEAGFVLEEDLGDALLSVVLDEVAEAGLGGDGYASPPPPVPLPQGEGGRGGAAGVPVPQVAAAGLSTSRMATVRVSHPRVAVARLSTAQVAIDSVPTPRVAVARVSGPSVDAATVLHAAIDALIPLQRAAPPPGLPAWNAQAMAETALGTLFDWWWPAAFGTPAPDAARAEVGAALAAILAPLLAGPRCFVHRDFFAGNLLWLPDRAAVGTTGARAAGAYSPPTPGASSPRDVGIIDFQGAAIGHPAYDLASLLQDARRDIPPAIAAEVLARYLTLRPELDPAAFRAAYAACAAQRHLRVACQWVRLALRDNRPQYLAYGQRTWRLLAQALEDPAVAPLARALDRWIPAEQRRNPPGLAA